MENGQLDEEYNFVNDMRNGLNKYWYIILI